MNDRYAQAPPQRTRSRFRRLAVAGATAVAIVTAGAAAAPANALSLDDDVLPPVEPALQQGLLSAQAVPTYPGFAILERFGARAPELRKAYTIRLIGAESEPFRSAAVFAAQQFKTISDVTITVAPGTLPEEPQFSTPGEILIFTDVDTCPWYSLACARPGSFPNWPPDKRQIDGGYMWIKPEIATRPIGDIRTVVAHELGHVLGLDHYSPEFEGQLQVMNPSAQLDTGGVYRQGDKNGIKFVSPPPSQFVLRDDNSPSAGRPTAVFGFGNKGNIPLKGDWDGDGTDTPGVFRPSYYFFSNFALRNSNTPGAANVELSFGLLPGDIPIAGDWDGDGTDTIGILRGNTFYLRHSNAPVSSFTSFSLADLAAKPLGALDRVLAGDWNGDGIDTIAIRRGDETRDSVLRGSWWYFYKFNSNNPSVSRFMFGTASDEPVVGDWDGDGADSFGFKRGEGWLLWNTPMPYSSAPDLNTRFGEAADKPLPGDWNGDGIDTVGVHR